MYVLWIMTGMLLIYSVRVISGPTIWDRFLGFNLISVKIVIIIIVYSSIKEAAYLLDFAIVYSLLGFMGVFFIAYFLLDRQRGEMN